MKYLILFLFLIFGVHSASAQILAEAFRSIGCTNCSTPDKQYEAYSATNPGGKTVYIVYIHNDIATGDDPFYAIAKSDIDARMAKNFYFIVQDPTLFVNGKFADYDFGSWKTETDKDATS